MFSYNGANFFSNAVFFEGTTLIISFSFFRSNSPYYTKTPTAFEKTGGNGGGILFTGMLMQIRYCEFFNNSKGSGADINILDKKIFSSKILISNCRFLNTSSTYGSLQITSSKIKLLKLNNNLWHIVGHHQVMILIFI